MREPKHNHAGNNSSVVTPSAGVRVQKLRTSVASDFQRQLLGTVGLDPTEQDPPRQVHQVEPVAVRCALLPFASYSVRISLTVSLLPLESVYLWLILTLSLALQCF